MLPLNRQVGWLPRLLLTLTLIFIFALPSPHLCGAEVARRPFAIPAANAEVTLETFSDQAGAQLVYLIEDVRGVATNPVQGPFAPREALERLVARTELRVEVDGKTGALLIRRDRKSRAPPESPKPTTQAPTHPMKSPRPFLAALAAWLAVGAAADAQTASADRVPAAAGTPITLSPFQVNTAKDTSYGALNSNAISAFNMELFKTPVAADIFTQDFMRDIATTNVEDLLAGYGAGFGEVQQTPDSSNVDNQPGDRVGLGPTGSRGVLASDKRRNGFNVSATNAGMNDTFDTERVEVVKGANALLFGSSGAGGFVNTTGKQARFGRAGQPLSTGRLTSRIDQFGSKRWEFDGNYGLEKLAFRFVLLNEDKNYRRLFIGHKTDAFYAALAAKLPFNTTVHLNARKSDNDRINQTSFGDINFTNATRDPRHNFSLMYMLATNQAGATHPVTGAAYPAGPIANGKLSWDNASSFAGWAQQEDINSELYTVTIDTVWTKWLATSIGAMYDFATSQRGAGVGALLAPRAFNTANPYDDWAIGSTFVMNRNNDLNAGRRHAYRASAVLTNDLFKGRARSQTVFGYDLNFSAIGGIVQSVYYEADSSFRMYDANHPRPAGASGPTSADALGRFTMGPQYWPVGQGLLKKPFFRPGSRQVTVGGRNYVLSHQNPRHPNFVTPLNPLGLASLTPGLGSIAGNNLGGFAQSAKDYGLYGANYTRWFDDRFTTLFGYRFSSNFTRRPNTVASGSRAWTDTENTYSSYNFGATYRAAPWLYAYYNAGRTFLPFTRFVGDPYGEVPQDTDGLSQEIGFKYQPANGKISGSISYYLAKSRQENFNLPAVYRDLANPVGLNDAFNPTLRGTWIGLDKKSSGLEIILTAAPTRNWRARLGFTQQDGKILTATSYAMLWNDEFAYNRATGGVTYTDGAPFLVPTDAAGLATLNTTTTLRAPVVGAENTQLTLGMMNDPANPYYAYGQGGTVQPNGRITANSLAFRALRYFQVPAASGGGNVQSRTLRTGLPISAIPYAFNDPAGYKGIVPISSIGEPTLGHPLYRIVFTNTHDFTEGRLRGVTVGGTVRWDIDKRTNWYTEPDGRGGNIRKLYKESSIDPQVSPFLAYQRKLGRYAFRTQLNVNNVFNRYQVELRPNATFGYTVENAINATFVGAPREYVWTNTLSF